MQEDIRLLMSGFFSGDLKDSDLQRLKNHLEMNLADRKIFEDYRLLWEESGVNLDLKPIDVESALLKTKLRLFFRKTSIVRFLLRTAAIFVLAGLFSTAYIYHHNSNSVQVAQNIERPVIMQEISSVYGTRSEFQLSDGTTVFLNSGSKLKFPSEFKGNSRKVELVGEAFFKIAPDSTKPFSVKAKGIIVKALGTAFDLQAYPKSSEISTTLLHGKVLIEKDSCGKVSKLAVLKPLDRAVFNTADKAIKVSTEEDLDKFIGWKDGKLVFFDDPIGIVSEKLGNWYNVTVKISSKELSRYRFTCTFTDEPIEQVLELLSKSSPIKYQIKKAVRLADNSYSKREVIFN